MKRDKQLAADVEAARNAMAEEDLRAKERAAELKKAQTEWQAASVASGRAEAAAGRLRRPDAREGNAGQPELVNVSGVDDAARRRRFRLR